MSKKTTPAIRSAEKRLQHAFEHLRASNLGDLQQRVCDNCLDPHQQQVLMYLLSSLQALIEAEQTRDSGGHQQDMFAHLEEREFAAWQRPINQPTLF